jgi:Omp85 superfamily domain
MRFLLVISLFLIELSFATVSAVEEEKVHAPPESFYAFGGVPALNYSSDAGFGFGVITSVYKKTPVLQPYKFAIDLQLFMTSKGLHSHYIRTDILNMARLPLRLRGKIGLLATINENFCGFGVNADCDAMIAQNALGVSASEEMLHRYFLYRYFEVYGTIDGRYRLRDAPHKIEFIAAWRGSYYWPGKWGDYTPYPDTLYANNISADNQKGFASVLEAGVMFDGRDNEPSPTKGYWIETTLRQSSPYWGSHWSYLGLNLSLRGYLPFDAQRRWVLAGQTIFDGMAGEAPLQEIVRVGGTLLQTAYGGEYMGRGISSQRFPGQAKIIKQLEIRYRFWGFDAWKQHFDTSVVTFLDLAVISWKMSELENYPFKALLGFGGGFRWAWNEAFIVRLDLGFSPIESYSPRFYVKIGNVF